MDSEAEQETPSVEELLTTSSRGRQRRRNSKYCDYQVEVSPRVHSKRGRPPSKQSLAKDGAAGCATQQPVDGEGGAAEPTPQQLHGKNSAVKRTTKRGRKTAAGESAKVNPGSGHDVDSVQQENGSSKPKRKYTKRKTPVTEIQSEEQSVQPDKEKEEEEEVQPGGRRRRSAAKMALKYLQNLANEVFGPPPDETEPDASDKVPPEPVLMERRAKGSTGCRGRKRKRHGSEDDEDEDFVPTANVEDEVESEETGGEEEPEDLDLEYDSGKGVRRSSSSYIKNHRNSLGVGSKGKAQNGLLKSIMNVVWDATETTKKFREEHYSSSVFPEWLPSTNHWFPVPQRDLDKHLPQQLQSVEFKVTREGLSREETLLQSLGRFEASAAHPDRWDMSLYTGGPVWAMEWCPTPDGAAATQYIAVACHQGMDDIHHVHKMYSGPGLIQLWDMGKLGYNQCPDSVPTLAYGLAHDHGFTWTLKWCPAGAWEPPTSGRKGSFLPRLGLLAASGSTGVVTIYSLPHPDALNTSKNLQHCVRTGGGKVQELPIYKAQGVVTLKMGSSKRPRQDQSGQVLSMDWLPQKPHNVIAIGFYDGMVGFWDLTTQSSLLQVRESDQSLSLLPYRCLLAHDHSVRSLAFCPASRHLLATAGEDRYIKTWDLRKMESPNTVQKRYLTNEICWPLNAPGLFIAQDIAYVPKGSQGVHYFDHFLNSVFAVPRTGSVWSMSFSDWTNCVMSADALGEPVYIASLVPNNTTEEGGEEEEWRGAAPSELDRGSEGGSGNMSGGDPNPKCLPLSFQMYKEAVRKYCLQHKDGDMRSMSGLERRTPWKQMCATEMNGKLNLDDMTLSAVHKVRFNPNLCSHVWVASGGQTGIIRLNCVRVMITDNTQNIISESRARFEELDSHEDEEDNR